MAGPDRRSRLQVFAVRDGFLPLLRPANGPMSSGAVARTLPELADSGVEPLRARRLATGTSVSAGRRKGRAPSCFVKRPSPGATPGGAVTKSTAIGRGKKVSLFACGTGSRHREKTRIIKLLEDSLSKVFRKIEISV
jgi:hypothetical protein